MFESFKMQPLTKTKMIYHAFGLKIASTIPFLDMPQTEGVPDVVYMKMNVQHRTPNVQRRIMMSLRSPKYLRENE